MRLFTLCSLTWDTTCLTLLNSLSIGTFYLDDEILGILFVVRSSQFPRVLSKTVNVLAF